MRHLVSLKDQTRDDIFTILEIARRVKDDYRRGDATPHLSHKTLIMLFEKSSTRTRLSFEAGMTELGGHAIYLDARSTQLSLADFKDEIRAIMRMGHALMYRARRAESVLLAASMNVVPVIDACSEKYHPCQALGDLLTMSECKGGLENVKKVVWLGIENNVSNTLMIACAKMGIHVYLVSPEADPESLDPELNAMAERTGFVHRTLNLEEALKNADFVHTDTWLNMEFFENGKVKDSMKEEFDRRVKVFAPYQLSAQLLERYNADVKIMHCMPCHVGYEITRDAIDSPNSIIFDQAENRKHIQKGILLWLLGKANI